MGGNVFKELKTVRLTAKEYASFEFSIARDLNDIDEIELFQFIPHYASKESFGDMDILVSYECEEQMNNIMRYISGQFASFQVSRNSNVLSVAYPLYENYFQVDFIFVDEIYYESSLSYYSYNDLGNLRGRIAHMLGLKLGHQGLQYIHRESDQVVFTIDLCQDAREIDRFLGFSDENIQKMWGYNSPGPQTLEDIFEYVVSSKYFNPDIFLLHNRNHVSRVRDAKRRTYMLFLEYCNSLPVAEKPYFKKPFDKSLYAQDAIDHFNKRFIFDMKMKSHERKKLLKSKFNGDIVMQVTGLQGKELGNLMIELRGVFRTMGDKILLKLSDESIRSIIKDFSSDCKDDE